MSTGTSPSSPSVFDPPERIDKGCPLCFAQPDEACVTASGKPRNDHKVREYVENDGVLRGK